MATFAYGLESLNLDCMTLTHNPAFEGARWAYAAYVLNPKIAADRGITEADMIGFASVPDKSEPRPTHA